MLRASGILAAEVGGEAAVVSAIACILGAAIPLMAGVFETDDDIRVPIVVGATAAGCLVSRYIALLSN